MTKYKVGDKVKIYSKLADGTPYGGICTGIGMEEFAGMVVEITKAWECDNYSYYKIKEDDGSYNWTKQMFDETYIRIEHLTNSQLWKLAEDGKINDGDEFECTIKSGLSSDKIHYYGGWFFCKRDVYVQFHVHDKWIQLTIRPKMSKADAEREFGIEIIDQ